MGQAISVGADNVATFKRMVKCCYYGDLKKLKKFKHEKCMTYQISRAAYLNWCQNQQANIHAIIDSLEKERANDKFIQEKMEFFNAVENQQLGLGDTLLHVAVVRSHRASFGVVADYIIITLVSIASRACRRDEIFALTAEFAGRYSEFSRFVRHPV